MISRYTTPESEKIWSDKNKFKLMLEIEILACQSMAEMGKIPSAAVKTIRKKARIDIERIREIEKTTHHDVIAFLQQIEESVGPQARYIHRGLTSSDALDTALSLQMKESLKIILDDLRNLADVLKRRARTYKHTLMVGRTHGIYAEPVTFGLKLALWYSDTLRNIKRIEELVPVVSVGKISGAVGTYANVSPQVESYVCRKLGLQAAPVSTQVLQRDRHAQFMTVLGIITSTVEKFATEFRSLQRTDIREVEEYFSKGQKGSSAMPHKRNPIVCEQLCGLARVVRGNVTASLENIALWHERDITHSSVERIILADSSILTDYMLKKFIGIAEHLTVYPDNMKKNLEKANGLIFSQRVMLRLIDKGLGRDKSYRIVQRNAMRVWKEESNLCERLKSDPEMKKHLTRKEIEDCFDYKYHLKNIDGIFKRLKI